MECSNGWSLADVSAQLIQISILVYRQESILDY